jgi:hypothetical protein
MIPELRADFNARFTPGKYQEFLRLLDARSGSPVKFRNCETPLFLPESILSEMAQAGVEMITQLTGSADYLAAAEATIPPGYRTAGEVGKPLFVQADFGLVDNGDGTLSPRLVEIQGFPSLYAYQLVLSSCYRDAYSLDPGLRDLPGEMTHSQYDAILRRAIVGNHHPENVVLLEVDPESQKTLGDFQETERRYGIRTIDIRAVKKNGDQLVYQQEGREVPIHRIYNRAIADEMIRRNVELQFSFADDLQVEWAGHPNWFFLISKFSLPYLRHPAVPKTWFLDELDRVPDDLNNFVLKPLYSFAGLGVTIGPSPEDLLAVAPEKRHGYILQERVNFVPTVETPHGLTKCEIRVMYVYEDRPRAVNTIIRMGRGKMMGVDRNRNMDWVGASAAFHQ